MADTGLPNIPSDFKPNPNLDKSRDEITFMIDDVMDSLRNISENSAYVKGQFGNSLTMVADDFLEKANGLASFTRDSFTPAVDLMKDYEDALEIVQNYDENIYKEHMNKLEMDNSVAEKNKVDTLDVKDANGYFKIENDLLKETPMTKEEYIEALNTMKSSIEQLGEHNIVPIPLRGGEEIINLDTEVDSEQVIDFTNNTVTTKYGVSPTCLPTYSQATEKYGVTPTCLPTYSQATEKYGVTPTCKQ